MSYREIAYFGNDEQSGLWQTRGLPELRGLVMVAYPRLIEVESSNSLVARPHRSRQCLGDFKHLLRLQAWQYRVTWAAVHVVGLKPMRPPILPTGHLFSAVVEEHCRPTVLSHLETTVQEASCSFKGHCRGGLPRNRKAQVANRLVLSRFAHFPSQMAGCSFALAAGGKRGGE